jgi:Na+/H+ antiporter NhaA
VFGAAALAIRARWADPPAEASWLALFGTSVLTGIGFTMSLFIGTLGFGETDYEATMRLGVLLGSVLLGALGAGVAAFRIVGSSGQTGGWLRAPIVLRSQRSPTAASAFRE